MPNLNPRDARTYTTVQSWKYDPQSNTLWLKLRDVSSNDAWFPIQLTSSPQSVDHTGAA
jgi:hypothetical protein